MPDVVLISDGPPNNLRDACACNVADRDVWPATVIAAVRADWVVAATENVTDPSSVPPNVPGMMVDVVHGPLKGVIGGLVRPEDATRAVAAISSVSRQG